MIKVYYAAPSIYGRKVLTVLEEKELDYEIERLSFASRDHQKEDYLKLNPNGEIPTLADEGFTVYESTAIIEYLEDEYPEPPLMPEDSEGRARVRMAEDYCDLHLYPELVRILKKTLKQEAVTEEDSAAVAERFKRIETFLNGQQYISGSFSLADCAVAAAVATAEALGVAEPALSSEPLRSYAARLKQRKSWHGASLISLEAAASK